MIRSVVLRQVGLSFTMMKNQHFVTKTFCLQNSLFNSLFFLFPWKNFLPFRMFLFIFILPALQAILFCLAIGREPTFLKVAIVNEELDPSQGRVCNYTNDCTYSMFSCRYLRHLDNTTVVQVYSHNSLMGFLFLNFFFFSKVPYTNYTEALEATRRGDVWGVIHFGQNFTDELVVRQSDGNAADNETILASQIGVSLDWSSKFLFILNG